MASKQMSRVPVYDWTIVFTFYGLLSGHTHMCYERVNYCIGTGFEKPRR
jgi:hypothetical protein